MNGNLGVFISCIFWVFIVESESSIWIIKPEIAPVGKDGFVDMKFSASNPGSHINNGTRQVDTTVYKTVYKYVCSLDSIIEGSHLILYESSGWKFPKQNASVLFQYPENLQDKTQGAGKDFEGFIVNGVNVTKDKEEDYIITGFEVLLFMDGPDSEGFIKEGGVLQESVSLLFLCRELTVLRYEIWLFGIKNETPLPWKNIPSNFCLDNQMVTVE